MSIKNGEVKSFNNRFIDKNNGKTSLKQPKIDNYAAIQKGLNELNINSFKNSPDGLLHTNPYNIEALPRIPLPATPTHVRWRLENG